MSTWKWVLLKFFGFGVGFGIVCASVTGLTSWYSSRPKKWKDSAITAKATALSAQDQGDEVHIKFRYALTNNTGVEYSLPSGSGGVLMRELGDKSLVKLDYVNWDNTIRIPPRQTINETFDITYKLADYDLSAADLHGRESTLTNQSSNPSKELTDFLGRRTEEISSLVFLDYLDEYRIVMPNDLSHLQN